MLLFIYPMDCWFLAFLFMYVAMDIFVFIVFHFMDSIACCDYRD